MNTEYPNPGSPGVRTGNAEEWRQRLLERTRAGRDGQREAAQHDLLVAAATSSAQLAALVREALRLGSASWQVPSLQGWHLDGEIRSPQPATAERLWATLSGGGWSRAQAADEDWWLRCFAAWAEAGSLPDPPGNAIVGSIPTAALDHPSDWSDDTARAADDAVRVFLRYTGGIPHVRRQQALTVMDSPLAEAWWQAELAHRAAAPSRGTEPTFESALRVLSERGVWNRRRSGAWVLPQQLFRRTPRLAHPNALAGIVLALGESDSYEDEEVQALLRRLASRSLLFDFDFVSSDEVAEMCR